MATTTAPEVARVPATRDYGTLRLWSVVFAVLGFLAVVGTTIGIIVALTQFSEFWQGFLFLVIGAPIALLLATWPIAFSQMMRAIVFTAEDVSAVRHQQR